MDMTVYTHMPFNDADSMKIFLLANSLAHSQVAGLLEQRGKSITVYPIDDIGNDPIVWLSNHATMHLMEFNQIGLTGLPDLEDVDFKDEQQFYDWMELHGLVHQTVNQALAIVT
jgi:hypothetical protein